MLTAERRGTPLGAYLVVANPAKTTLMETALGVTVHTQDIEGLIAYRGYDSNPLRVALMGEASNYSQTIGQSVRGASRRSEAPTILKHIGGSYTSCAH